MPKRSENKNQNRLEKHVTAEKSEYERVITKNRDLHNQLADLRRRYSMPNFRSSLEQVKWIRSQTIEVSVNLNNEMKAIAQEHNISERMNDALWYELWAYPHGIVFSYGFPIFSVELVNGEYRDHPIITPETDLENPIVLDFLKAWQQREIKKRDSPPQPQPIKGIRKLDWMPVWEWNMRHPHITRKEIAAMMNRTYPYVKSKLEELDKQAGETPSQFPSKSSM